MNQTFAPLEHIARRPMARLRLQQLAALSGAKKNRGESATTDERLDMGLAAYDFGHFSFEEALCFVTVMLASEANDRMQEVYEREFSKRFEAIRKKHGLGPNEFWAAGEGPEENQVLGDAFDAACDRVELEVLQEHADRLGHPLLREAADLLATDRAEFMRRREGGRQSLFGPFKE